MVKQSFPHAVGWVTGIYTSALTAGAGISAAATPMLESLLGSWRGALGAWAVLSLAAVVVWSLSARHGGIPAPPAVEPAARKSLRRVPLAWVVTAFFATQACAGYMIMGWLAEYMVSEGFSRSTAGMMLAVINLIAIPLNFVVPVMALRGAGRSRWIVALTAISTVGVFGFAVAPDAAPWVWSVFVGIGFAILPLALGVITMRTRDAADISALSAMAQGFGYLIAAAGPLLFSLLHGLTAGWAVPFVLLGVVTLLQGGFGWYAGRPRYI